MDRIALKRAADLVHARDAIEEFLNSRDAESDTVQALLNSEHDFRRRDGRKLLKAEVVELSVTDAKSCAHPGDPDTLDYWFLPRDVLEGALRHQLTAVREELAALGIETDLPGPAILVEGKEQ